MEDSTALGKVSWTKVYVSRLSPFQYGMSPFQYGTNIVITALAAVRLKETRRNDLELRRNTAPSKIERHWSVPARVYSHIPQRFASLVNAFCRDHLNPYVNFHRPCLFAETITDAKGRQRKRYPYKLMMTPYEKLKSLHKAEQFLKPDITFLQLDAQARALSDNEAAKRLNDARTILFKTIFNRSKSAA